MNRRAILAALVAVPATARAHSYKQGVIAIGHAWALPAAQGDGQVFFPLSNTGEKPDALVGARSNICALIELRRNNRYDDPPLGSLSLEPDKPVPMRPTARHLRLVSLRQPLIRGETFSLILDFLSAGEIEITVYVESAPGD